MPQSFFPLSTRWTYARRALHGVAHRHSGHPGCAQQGLGGELRPQQYGEIDALARRRDEAPFPPAPASGLEVGGGDGFMGRALEGFPLQIGVGGIHFLQAPQVRADGVRLQEPADFSFHQHVRCGGEAVAQTGTGVNDVAVPAQEVDGLPHSGAADAQAFADLLTRKEFAPSLLEQLVNTFSTHNRYPPYSIYKMGVVYHFVSVL